MEVVKQRTIKENLSFSGIGVHSGCKSTVTLIPAAQDAGIVFYLKDLPQYKICIGSIVPEEAMHATVLRFEEVIISTVEHLMAALHVLAIDNIEICVDAPEVPILDGSALPFIQGILSVGITQYNAFRRSITPKERLILADDDGKKIIVTPVQKGEDGLFVSYEASFSHALIGRQYIEGPVQQAFFTQEIAPARTFGFLEQLPFLRKHGLAQGTSLGNTVVVGSEGYMNERRFSDEFVRHKYLDLIGDLFLMGYQLIGRVDAYKTGHSFNRLLIKHVIDHPDLWIVC